MTLIYTIISICGICYLAVTNPKRRRAFNLAILNRRRWVWAARLSIILPFLLLIFTANWSGLSIWAGAVTVLGWIVAATSPHHLAAVRRASIRVFEQVRNRSSAAISSIFSSENSVSGKLYLKANKHELSKARKKIKQLEGKIEKLEKKLADLDMDTNQPVKDEVPSLKIVKN